MAKRDNLSRRDLLKIAAAGTVLSSGLWAPEAQASEKAHSVMLDAGHGVGNGSAGLYDPGTVNLPEKIHEADITYDVAQELGKILLDKGLAIAYTRPERGSEISLTGRSTLANQINPEIFTSIHVNSATNANAQGVRTYHHPRSASGKKLGRSIQDALVGELTTAVQDFSQGYDGLRTNTFSVLKKTKMPAVLVEIGFMTNDRDREYMVNHQDTIAQGIAIGIENYFK